MIGQHQRLAEPEAEPAAASDANTRLAAAHPLFAEAPGTVSYRKLRKRLVREARQAIADFAMLPRDAGSAEKRPRWLVCLSGGKDSFSLLAVLVDLHWRGLLPVDLIACNLDQGQPGFPQHVLPEFLTRYGIAHHIERADTYSIVTDKVPAHQTYCALCSRLRRGHLYRIAREQGCAAIVLGHHGDDALETLFLNLFYGGRLAAMPGKLVNDEGDIAVLRPLIYSCEGDIARFAEAMAFPIIPCDLCGSQDGLQRGEVKALLQSWETANPGRRQVMLRALSNVRPSHLLDRGLFDFAGLVEQMSDSDH